MNFKEKYGEWAVVAGATEGVGSAMAEKLAGFGMSVVLLGRRSAMLEELSDKIRSQYGVDAKVLVQDLAEPNAAEILFNFTADLDVGFVSYVACKSVFGRYEKASYEDRLEELQTNVISLTKVTYLYYKLFREKGRGCIFHIASASGVNGVPCLTGYAATKAYIIHLCRTLSCECLGTGVDVGVAILGSTSTPAFIRSQPEGPAGEAAMRDAISPEDTLDEIFDRWDKNPCIVVGEKVRASVLPYLPARDEEKMLALMRMYDR